jgi:hypothetical protein
MKFTENANAKHSKYVIAQVSTVWKGAMLQRHSSRVSRAM